MSPELIKIQAELGAQNTYRKCASMLTLMTGKRSINNASRIHRTTNIIGEQIEEHIRVKDDTNTITDTVAKELVVNVDGGYIHDADNKGHNFEAMSAKIYRPENLIHVGSTMRPVITEKHCAGSAKKDKQSTMIKRFKKACKLEGLSKKTNVIALADGAKNCWNIIRSIAPLCLAILYILDWFHIGKYVTTVKRQLPDAHHHDIDAVKNELWHGRVTSALKGLDDLLTKLSAKKHIDKVTNFRNYIDDNKDYIVNYNDRKESSLIYTSNVAESTVEHYISARFRKQQKMQWKRKSADGVLQIRASMISGDWNRAWKIAANKFYMKNVA